MSFDSIWESTSMYHTSLKETSWSLEKLKVVSPTTFMDEQRWADWFVGEIFPFRPVTVDALFMLPVAPELKV